MMCFFGTYHYGLVHAYAHNPRKPTQSYKKNIIFANLWRFFFAKCNFFLNISANRRIFGRLRQPILPQILCG